MSALAVIGFSLTSPVRVEACECAAITPCQALSFANAIFTGVVTDISPIITPDGKSMSGSVTTIVADRTFVGGDTRTYVFRSKLSSCDYPFRVGERYLVFATRESDGSFGTSTCNRTKSLAEAGEDLAYLTSLPPAGAGGQLAGTIERSQIDLLGVRRDEKLTSPAEGVAVAITGSNGLRVNAITDAAGRFQANGLPAGTYRIDLDLPRTKIIGDRELRLADRGCAATTLHLVSDGRIEGRVVDGHGDPVARAVVSAMPAAFTNRVEFPHVWVRTTAADAGGAFAFDGLPAGEYHVGVNVEFGTRPELPYAPVWFPGVAARIETTPIRLTDGQRRAGIEIVVGDKLRVVTIEGVVLNPDGTPAAGAYVTLKSRDGVKLTTASGRTDAAGAFKLTGLERVAYTVEASLYPALGTRLFATVEVTPTLDEPALLKLMLAPDQE